MSSLESNKNLAGIGVILFALGFIPGAGIVLGIIGIILLLIGLKGIAEYYQEPGIYQHALMGVIYGIIGLVAAAVLTFGFTFSSIFAGLTLGLGAGLVSIGLLVLVIVVLFVFYLLMAINFRKSFDILARKTGDHMFETAGLLLFIGAILTIIVIGLALVFIAFILACIALFSIRATQPTQPGSYTPPPPSTSSTATGTRICPNCGAPIDNPNAIYCTHCGKPLS